MTSCTSVKEGEHFCDNICKGVSKTKIAVSQGGGDLGPSAKTRAQKPEYYKFMSTLIIRQDIFGALNLIILVVFGTQIQLGHFWGKFVRHNGL